MKGKAMEHLYSPLKIIHHRNKIEQLKKGDLIYPTQIQIDLTNECNHNCPFCFYRCAKDDQLNAKFCDKDFIPNLRACELIDEFKELGIPAIQFTGGGEPLKHPDFHKILSHTINNGMEWSLVTNGVLLNSDYVDLYKTATWIRVSVDAASKEIYNKSQGCNGSDYEKVIENIKMLVKHCGNVEIGLSFVVNPINFREIIEFKKLAEYLKVNNIRYSVSYTPKGIKIFKEHWLSVLEETRQVVSDEKSSLKVFDLINNHLTNLDSKQKNYSQCGYQHFTSVIGADLNVYPCCTLKYNSVVCFGNLKNRSFKDIWTGKERLNWIVSDHIKNVCNSKPCWMDGKNELINYLLIKNPPHVNFI